MLDNFFDRFFKLPGHLFGLRVCCCCATLGERNSAVFIFVFSFQRSFLVYYFLFSRVRNPVTSDRKVYSRLYLYRNLHTEKGENTRMIRHYGKNNREKLETFGAFSVTEKGYLDNHCYKRDFKPKTGLKRAIRACLRKECRIYLSVDRLFWNPTDYIRQ